jgi:tellurite resistance protein
MKDHHPTPLDSRAARVAGTNGTAMAAADYAVVEAIIAACALVALADDLVVARERQHLIRLICGNPALAEQSPAQIEKEFAMQSRLLYANPAAGRQRALRLIAEIAERSDMARIVLNACLLMTQADGQVTRQEIAAIKDIRNALKLDPRPVRPPLQR